MNYIEDFDVSEFPKSLRVLRLAGNPFVRHMPAYAHLFFERLPNLVQVDQFRRPSSTSSSEMAPSSVASSIASSSSESHAAVLPLPALHSPIDAYRALQVEVELPQHEQDVLEKQEKFEAENKAAFNLTDYEKQRSDRMSKWKLQLTALTSRTRERFAESGESIQAGASNRFRERRSLALSRARHATDAALVDAASHFKQVRIRLPRRKKGAKRPATN
jgi:hypothetical protein